MRQPTSANTSNISGSVEQKPFVKKSTNTENSSTKDQKDLTASSDTIVDFMDVGCCFVDQYYSILSSEPEKLHHFYGKTSQVILGINDDSGSTLIGQKEIHERLVKLYKKDSSILILRLDAMPTLGSGIILNVKGKICFDKQKSEKLHEFYQTFVLAEQPDGYYVINDIIRIQIEDACELEVVEEQAQQGSSSLDMEKIPEKGNEAKLDKPVSQDFKVSNDSIPNVKPEVQSAIRSDFSEVKEPVSQEKTASKDEPSSTEKQTPVMNKPTPSTWANLAAKETNKWGTLKSETVKGTSVVASKENTHKDTVIPAASAESQSKDLSQRKQTKETQVFVKKLDKAIADQQILKQLFETQFGANSIKNTKLNSNKASATIQFESSDLASKALEKKVFKAALNGVEYSITCEHYRSFNHSSSGSYGRGNNDAHKRNSNYQGRSNEGYHSTRDGANTQRNSTAGGQNGKRTGGSFRGTPSRNRGDASSKPTNNNE